MPEPHQVEVATATTTPPTTTTHRRTKLAAAVMMAAALMDMLDVTVVNVAMPTIHTQLHASATAIEWMVSGYMLAFAATLITAGRLGDLFGGEVSS